MDSQASISEQRRISALRRYGREMLVLLDADGEVETVLGAARVLGYPVDETTESHVAEHVHPDDLARVLEVLEWGRKNDPPSPDQCLSVRVRDYEGSWRVFGVRAFDARLDPELGGFVLQLAETVQPDETDAFAEGEARFLSLAEVVPSGILSADARGWVVFSNEAAEQILDVPADHLRRDGWERVVASEDLGDVLSAAGAVLNGSEREQVTFRVRASEGLRWVHATFVPLGAPGARTGWIATLEDVTERRRVESRLAHLATHDPLTGLPNRTLLEDRLGQACARLRRGTSPVGVVFCDLDDFKAVNDQLGHAAGDEVLVEVARRLTGVLRPEDTVARFGGDEFVAVCESIDLAGLPALLDRIRDALSVPMLVGGQQVEISASIGGITTDEVSSPDDLLAMADQAMYRDKRASRSA